MGKKCEMFIVSTAWPVEGEKEPEPLLPLSPSLINKGVMSMEGQAKFSTLRPGEVFNQQTLNLSPKVKCTNHQA